MNIQIQNIHAYPKMGGIEIYMHNVARHLSKCGHHVHVLCSNSDDKMDRIDKGNDGIEIYRYVIPRSPHWIIAPLSMVLSLIKIIRRHNKIIYNKSDIILANNAYFALASIFSGDKIPVYYIVHALSAHIERAVSVSGIKARMYSFVLAFQNMIIEHLSLSRAVKVITVSNMRKREILDFCPFVKSRKISVIPNGVDLEKFVLKARDHEFMDSLHLPFKCKVILTVCRLEPEKNISFLLSAFSQLKIPDAFLVIVGDGSCMNELKQQSIELGIKPDRIRWMGFQRDTEKFYSIADVFVLPSTYEGFPLVFLEAMACGVPCIGIQSCYPDVIVSTEEVIDYDKTGYWIESNNEHDLIEKLQILLLNDEKRKSFSLAARKGCEQKYSWRKYTNRLNDIICEVKN